MAEFTKNEQRVIDWSYEDGKSDASNTFDGNQIPSLRELMGYDPKREELESGDWSGDVVNAAMKAWAEGYRYTATKILEQEREQNRDDEGLDGLPGRGFLGR